MKCLVLQHDVTDFAPIIRAFLERGVRAVDVTRSVDDAVLMILNVPDVLIVSLEHTRRLSSFDLIRSARLAGVKTIVVYAKGITPSLSAYSIEAGADAVFQQGALREMMEFVFSRHEEPEETYSRALAKAEDEPTPPAQTMIVPPGIEVPVYTGGGGAFDGGGASTSYDTPSDDAS